MRTALAAACFIVGTFLVPIAGNAADADKNPSGTSGTVKASVADRVEARITDMHARLKLTELQEGRWSEVAQTMRDNARQMDALTKTRAEKVDMSAVDDLKSYGDITEAHAYGMKRFTQSFASLYDNMSDAQKRNADALFRHGGRRPS